jgi:hypothetical protein
MSKRGCRTMMTFLKLVEMSILVLDASNNAVVNPAYELHFLPAVLFFSAIQ